MNAFVAEPSQERPAIQHAVAATKPSYPPAFAAHSCKVGPTKQVRQQSTANTASRSFQESDDELVGRIRAGERGAFSQLVERYQRRVQQLALSFVRNEHDAQEVVQDAFLRVHLGLGGFRGTSSFYTWLYRIVVNLAIDAKRRPYRQRVG